MSAFITSVHVIVAVILMISVLLQTGKGSGLGAAFGGSSSSVFGARGPATFISRVTTVAAVIFMLTSLTLSVFAQGANKRGSVVVDEPEPAAVVVPVEGRAVPEEAVQTPATTTLTDTKPEATASEAAAPDFTAPEAMTTEGAAPDAAATQAPPGEGAGGAAPEDASIQAQPGEGQAETPAAAPASGEAEATPAVDKPAGGEATAE